MKDEFSGRTYLEATIIEGLKFKTSFNFDLINYNTLDYTNPKIGPALENGGGWKSVYALDNEVLGEQGTLGRKTQCEIVLTRHLRMALKRQNLWMMDKQMTEAVVTYSQG